MTQHVVHVTETALRDGHQSLLATRLRTRDMLPIAEALDAVGYHALEVWGGATFDTCIRYLNEDPWQRLRDLRQRITHTPLQMLLRGQNLVGYKHYADDVAEQFVARAAANGISIFRIFDALNDTRNLELAVRAVNRAGAHAQGAICYTISPVHTVAVFASLARDLEQMGCDSLCIKDMAGLLGPLAARELLRAIRGATALPIYLHSHCTAGLAPMTYLAAVEEGAAGVDTAISPLAGGASQPQTESIVAALRGSPFDTGIDLAALASIQAYFANVRDKYGHILDPISERLDPGVLIHQIPGGMLSNLVAQLKQQDALDRLDEVLREVPRVRREMGYPPLVTPTSQIVGTQAVFNVLAGERYKMVSQEVHDYFCGLYGLPPAAVDEHVRRNVVGSDLPITCRPADLIPRQLDVLRIEAKQAGLSLRNDEDLLTFALFHNVAARFLRGEAEEEPLPVGPYASPPSSPEIHMRSSIFKVEVDGELFEVKVSEAGGIEIDERGMSRVDSSPAAAERTAGGIYAPMQGTVLHMKVQQGDRVASGDTVIVMESMKMQHNVTAPQAGVVARVCTSVGTTIAAGELLLVIEPLP